MTKMIDMSRDPEQLSEMVSSYDPEYPIGFFLDPRMVKELGLEGKQPNDEINIAGSIRIKSITKTDDKTEMYVSVKALGVVGDGDKTPADKMSESYSGDDNGNGKD